MLRITTRGPVDGLDPFRTPAFPQPFFGRATADSDGVVFDSGAVGGDQAEAPPPSSGDTIIGLRTPGSGQRRLVVCDSPH